MLGRGAGVPRPLSVVRCESSGQWGNGDGKEEADASITCLVPIIEYQSVSEGGWVIQSHSSSQSSS